MSKTKLLLLNVVSIVTIASLITGCCSFPSGVNISVDEGGEITVSLSTPEPEGTVLPGPGPTEVAFEPVEIVSERELAPEEFFQAVEGDETFQDVYALAMEQGYTEPEGGGEFVASDGMVVQGLLLSSAEEQLVVAFHFEWDEWTHSLLARLEAGSQTLVLYDRDGRAEISERGIRVFDAAGNPIGEPHSSERARPSGLASPLQDCEGPGPYAWSWEDFDHCGRSYSGAAWSQIGGCVASYVGAVVGLAFASSVAAPFVLVSGLVVIFFACRVPSICVKMARVDHAPTYDIRLPDQLPQPCRVECVAHGDRMARLTYQNYRIQVHIDDDRKKRPQSPQHLDVCASESKILRIRDCAGHQIDLRLQAPNVSDRDVQDCLEGETCVVVGDNAECRAGPEPQPTITLGTGDVQITLSWSPTTPDIDLHVTDPNGVHIWYSDKAPSNSAGRLDVDDKCGDTGVASGGPENIFWAPGQAPSGTYRVSVIYYKDCTGDTGAVRWTVRTLVDGVTTTYNGDISPDSGEVHVITIPR